jgi:transcriptional regulator with PAS, ATPase and Fis domain
MRYSYNLEGYDEERGDTWENQVRYESLPLGEYTFRVIAINRDFTPSESPAELKLKIIPDPRDLKVNKLESDLRLKNYQLEFLHLETGKKYQFENIIGNSEGIKWVLAMMDRAIDSGMNVLITGETGTGKELVAKGIHYNSPRKDKLPIPYNCGSVSRELIASQLFGYRKGAFTGANEDRIGLFEAARGSTVILDEISDMPLDVQSSLLRVLEERKVQRLGDYVLRDIDVRVIAITNRDLIREVEENRFREDLYYRLDGFHIYIPPLRERPGDIPQLAEHFCQEACREQKKNLKGFASGIIDTLVLYSWPGNVRELKNEVYRACALAEEGHLIQSHHFTTHVMQNEALVQETISEQLSYVESVKQFRRRLIEEALRKCNGNRTQAAKLLKMNRPNMVHLIKNLGIKE